MKSPVHDEFQIELRKGIKGDVSFDEFMLGVYSTDSSIYQVMPRAVVLPRDEEDCIYALRTALNHKVSVLPRGGGTSLGGQAAGSSMILDFSKYMNQVLEMNVSEKWVRVQPGLVLDELNAFLKQFKLHFAPDPATSSRATIGGVIGNNSSGTRSIIYGIARDHVLETKTLLSDGTILNFKEFSVKEKAFEIQNTNDSAFQSITETSLIRDFKTVIDDKQEKILETFPKIMRRVQGYNLDAFAATDKWNFSSLMTGSEGTLGVVLEAKLNLEPLPAHKIISAVHFSDLQDCIGSISPILEHKPSAVEILDDELIRLARSNVSTSHLTHWIEGEPGGILITEFIGDSEEEVLGKATRMAAALDKKKRGYAWPIITEPQKQADVWAVRKNGLGLLAGMKGERKPLAFIEDAAVPLEHLPDYIDQILKFCRQAEVPVLMYAHASVGLIHVKPALNLKDPSDIEHMKNIARHSFKLVKKYGGSISGEHGDGRTRSVFLEDFFGKEVYQAFRDVKNIFDPAGIMNPGIIVDPGPMDENLRYGQYKVRPDFPSYYNYREEGSFATAVETCTGVGACRQNISGLMCPSYRATRDEEHSTRGRANALRLAMTGQMGTGGMTDPQLFEIMDLCLSCKGCKSECPSNVDLAKLKSEFLQQYHEKNGASLRDKFVSWSPAMAKLFSGWMAPLVNSVQKTMLFRKILEGLVGIDSRRVLPMYAKKRFHNWFENHIPANGHSTNRIVLFDDTYMNYHETGVGISAVELLESCGYEVILAKAGCCQRPSISHGFLKKAKAEGENTLKNLKKYIDEGLKIVVCEPGCASALTDDLPDLVDDDELGKSIKENVMMIDVFLDNEIKAGNIKNNFISDYKKLIVHGHCHQKSLYGTTAMERVLKGIPGLEVEVLDSGCCGMAGSFGYEKEHYDMSMKVGEDRLFPAIRAKNDTEGLVACGFSCRHQISDGTKVKAKHWVEVLRGSTKA